MVSSRPTGTRRRSRPCGGGANRPPPPVSAPRATRWFPNAPSATPSMRDRPLRAAGCGPGSESAYANRTGTRRARLAARPPASRPRLATGPAASFLSQLLRRSGQLAGRPRSAPAADGASERVPASRRVGLPVPSRTCRRTWLATRSRNRRHACGSTRLQRRHRVLCGRRPSRKLPAQGLLAGSTTPQSRADDRRHEVGP